MLFDLKVLNGVMTPKFDKFNNIYSVTVEENVTELMLEYKTDSDNYVKVIGNNNFVNGDNIVLLEVVSSDNITTYTLLVYKEYTESVFKSSELLEIPKTREELPKYVAPTIASICIIIIIFFAILLFKKKKVK